MSLILINTYSVKFHEMFASNINATIPQIKSHEIEAIDQKQIQSNTILNILHKILLFLL